MAAADTYRKIFSAMLPAGALGMSLALGAATAEAARETPATQAPGLATPSPVGERLSAIREAVSQAIGEAAAPPVQAERLAWGNWANFGFPAWNNWHNGWRNWRNGWNNWNNWNNGWHNWGNGWRNW